MHKFTILADYFQFVLMDEKLEDDFSIIWTEDAIDRMLAVGSNAVCPGTLRSVDVADEIEVLRSPAAIDLAEWNHAVEASIIIPSGKLVVLGCTGYLPDATRIADLPGTYQLISLAGGHETIRNDGEPADDIYRVYLWPGQQRNPPLIKRWQRAAS